MLKNNDLVAFHAFFFMNYVNWLDNLKVMCIYVSVYFLAPEVQNGFDWCLVLESCFWSSQMNLVLLYTCVQKKTELFNSSPTSIVDTLRLLSAPSGRFWQQTAICPVPLWALVVELHPLNWAHAQAVCRINPTNSLKDLLHPLFCNVRTCYRQGVFILQAFLRHKHVTLRFWYCCTHQRNVRILDSFPMIKQHLWIDFVRWFSIRRLHRLLSGNRVARLVTSVLLRVKLLQYLCYVIRYSTCFVEDWLQ